MITEPTGWVLVCDQCGGEMHLDEEPEDRAELLDWAREDGWITVRGMGHLCSLECVLRWRALRTKEYVVRMVRAHVFNDQSGSVCCRTHGTHAQRGRHSLDCPNPRLRGVSVL